MMEDLNRENMVLGECSEFFSVNIFFCNNVG